MSPYPLRVLKLLVPAASLLSTAVFAQEASRAATTAKPTPPPSAVDHLGIKRIPQPGITIPENDRAELETGAAALGQKIESLRGEFAGHTDRLALLPDVEIFHKAVDWALRYDEFFEAKQIGIAGTFLEIGHTRADELAAGSPSWLSASGLVVRGYRSGIDGSVQPYGMVIPEDWKPGEDCRRRLDFWAHGRGEKLSELDFIHQRLNSIGEFNPPGAFTLHLYGRYCNANKFAGEVDLFEALDHARQHYNIDENRLVMRGFSMGGAAVWQFGTHYAGMWAAVQPGAGFAETREFNKVYAEGKTPPTSWEETLYRWYDATDYVTNLANTTTIAYSGEIDGQKQATDIMIRYARREADQPSPPAAEPNTVNPGDGSARAGEARVAGTSPDLAFYHVIGTQTPHKIAPEAKPEIESLIDAALAKRESSHRKVRFVTYTLIYPELAWIRVEGLNKQWERSEVRAEITAGKIVASTSNVTALRFSPDTAIKSVELDGADFSVSGNDSVLAFHRSGGNWVAGPSPANGEYLTKTPSICGPVDHAFMSSFVFVRPTGSGYHEKTGAWAASELDHAISFWRKVFRGEAPVKDDSAIADADIAASNLILWGDPASNAVLKKILPQLPLTWDAARIVLGGREYTAGAAMPILIFPNPLNPEKYIVLNSGPTFREDALLNNSQQIPKIPDWAIIDINTPVDGKWPGKVITAGFFDENWRLKTE